MAAALPSPEALGTAVRALRQGRGLTIEELAHQAELNWTYLSDIERGRANPSIGKLGAIAAALGVRVSELIAQAEGAGESETG